MNGRPQLLLGLLLLNSTSVCFISHVASPLALAVSSRPMIDGERQRAPLVAHPAAQDGTRVAC
jgi:hypothetical protein